MGRIYDMALEAASYTEKRIEHIPEAAIILGSGLSDLADEVSGAEIISYDSIPNFSKTTVEGHAGALAAGMLEGRYVLCLKGRFHYYEGYDIEQVVFPVRMLAVLGVKNLIVTNAAGGLNKNYSTGDIMLIKDHISLFCRSPLTGENDSRFGDRFPDMTNVYDPGLLRMAAMKAVEYGLDIKEGVYAYTQGPMYETPAEVRALTFMGGDAVGMSTVPEVITAHHCGMRVLGVSFITNMAAGISGNTLSHEEVVEEAKQKKADMKKLLKAIISAV